MKDFEIDLRLFLFSFWKIRYHILIFPFICILLVLAHGLSGKILKKNILVYDIQFINTNIGNSNFLKDTSSLMVYHELSKKWGLDPYKLRDSIIIEGISPKSAFIEEKFKNRLKKPGLKPAEINELANAMVKQIKNANKLAARISFDYQKFGLSFDQASDIIISFPSAWNKLNSKSNFNMFSNIHIAKGKMDKIFNQQDTSITNLNIYQKISNAIEIMTKLENSDPRGYQLLSSKSGETGSEIKSNLEMVKAIYLIPFFNAAVSNKTTDIIAFLNNYKMDKLEIEEKLNGIINTIQYLKKSNVFLDIKADKKSLDQNENSIKSLSLSRNTLESKLFVDLLSEKNTLEKELAKTKRNIYSIEKMKYEKSIISSSVYKTINEILISYNGFINDYKKSFYIKDEKAFNPLIKPRLTEPIKPINTLHLLLGLLVGLCVGVAYGLITLLIVSINRSKLLVDDIKN